MIVTLTEDQKIKIQNSQDIFGIMQNFLLEENEVDRDREHFWVMGLNNANRILFIEQISIGTIRGTLCEPLEVFSLAIQKRALGIILIHNHPSGILRPSEQDKQITDKLIQAGEILSIAIIDHLIITTKSYISFEDSFIMEELKNSNRYIPRYKKDQELKKESLENGIKKGKDLMCKEIANNCFALQMDSSLIATVTTIPLKTIVRLEKSFNKLSLLK